ncbi:unnamed protein product, partial [Nesidiocoris tenuis]
MGTEVKSGWADSMLKIAKSKRNADVPVLGQYVKRPKPAEKPAKNDDDSSSSDDEKPTITSLQLRERFARGRSKPNVLDSARERALSKIATRGVVQLFNAVRKHQGTAGNTDESSHKRRDVILKKVDKDSFLDILGGAEIKDET